MNTSLQSLQRWLAAIVLLASALVPAEESVAATNIVLAGEDLQTRINAAAPGDVMVVQSGTYGGDITVNKPLAFVRSGSADLQILGPVSINTSGTVSFNQCRFSDRVFVVGGTQLTIVAGRIDGLLGVTEAVCTLRQTFLQQDIQITNASLTMLRCTNAATLNAFAPPTANPALVITQSELGNLNATSYRVHCAYSKLWKVSLSRSTVVMVGNLMASGANGPTVECNQCNLTLRNNHIRNGAAVNRPGELYAEVFNIDVVDSEAVIENNTLIATRTYWAAPHPHAGGIRFEGNSTRIDIRGNIIRLNDNPTVAIRRVGNGFYDIAYNFHAAGLDNATAYASSAADPKIDADALPALDSPCRNAGPPDAIYNDRDGTRNDIGFTGGPLYNPALATTDQPMVFWLDSQPRKVLKGVNNTIRIEAAGTAGF